MPRAAAGCLLHQIVEDEGTAGDVENIKILEETLGLMEPSAKEDKITKG